LVEEGSELYYNPQPLRKILGEDRPAPLPASVIAPKLEPQRSGSVSMRPAPPPLATQSPHLMRGHGGPGPSPIAASGFDPRFGPVPLTAPGAPPAGAFPPGMNHPGMNPAGVPSGQFYGGPSLQQPPQAQPPHPQHSPPVMMGGMHDPMAFAPMHDQRRMTRGMSMDGGFGGVGMYGS
jgi:hypothetical protein